MGKAAAAPAGRAKTTDELDKEIKGLNQRLRELQAKLQTITGVEPDPHDGKMDGFLRKILGNLYVDSGPVVSADRAAIEAEISAIETALPALGEELDRQRQVALDLKVQELRPQYRAKVQELLETLQKAERLNDELFQMERESSFRLVSGRWDGLTSTTWLGDGTRLRPWMERTRKFLGAG